MFLTPCVYVRVAGQAGRQVGRQTARLPAVQPTHTVLTASCHGVEFEHLPRTRIANLSDEKAESPTNRHSGCVSTYIPYAPYA